MIRAGRLRQRVLLQKPTTAPDGMGQVRGWDDVGWTWAAVEPTRGRELLGSATGSQKIVNEMTALVVMRYRSDIDPSWRLVHNGVPYGIVSVESPLSRKATLELICRRVDTGEPV